VQLPSSLVCLVGFFSDDLHPALSNVSYVEMLTTNHKTGMFFCSCQEARIKMQLSEELGAFVRFPVLGACSLSENHKKTLQPLAAS